MICRVKKSTKTIGAGLLFDAFGGIRPGEFYTLGIFLLFCDLSYVFLCLALISSSSDHHSQALFSKQGKLWGSLPTDFKAGSF